MHPDATKHVTRNCYQTFCPKKTDFGISNLKTTSKGKFSSTHFLTSLLANFRAPSELPDETHLGNGCLAAIFASDFPHTPFLTQNKYPSQRNFLRGFLARKILTYLPLPPKLAVANTSSWLRRVFSHALSLSMIRVWAFPMFSQCSPPHVR